MVRQAVQAEKPLQWNPSSWSYEATTINHWCVSEKLVVVSHAQYLFEEALYRTQGGLGRQQRSG